MAECGLDLEDQRLAALYEYDVLDTPPEGWRRDWGAAAAHTFAPVEYTSTAQ